MNLSGPRSVTRSCAAPSRQHVLIKLATAQRWRMDASAANFAACLVTTKSIGSIIVRMVRIMASGGSPPWLSASYILRAVSTMASCSCLVRLAPVVHFIRPFHAAA